MSARLGHAGLLAKLSGPVEQMASLLHFDGSNGSTTIVDSKTGSWTVTGSAALTTAVKKFGTASLAITADGQYVSTTFSPYVSSKYLLGSTYSIEMQFYPDSFVESVLFMIAEPTQVYFAALQINVTPAGGLLVAMRPYTGATRVTISSADGVLTTGQWYHIALGVVAGTATIYVNGVSVGSGTLPDLVDTETTVISLGGLGNGFLPTYSVRGKIDEFCMRPQSCPYSGTFTPPTAAYT